MIVGALILVACPSTEHNTSRSGGGTQSKNGIAPLPRPNPLDVTVRTDQAHAKGKVLGPKGGTIKLRLPDGTGVDLKIPRDALTFETKIGIAPVAVIDG
jgi:hypothetical protein